MRSTLSPKGARDRIHSHGPLAPGPTTGGSETPALQLASNRYSGGESVHAPLLSGPIFLAQDLL
jgi:hypothetical protein